jgi:DNA repair ATPase RecN
MGPFLIILILAAVAAGGFYLYRKYIASAGNRKGPASEISRKALVLNKPIHKKYFRDSERVLRKIKGLVKSRESKERYGDLYETCRKQLQDSRNILAKIDSLYTLLRSDAWNYKRIARRLKAARKSSGGDSSFVDTLQQQLDNIENLTRRYNELQREITAMAIHFNTIYTKLALLNAGDRVAEDEVESDIQRVLDRELNVRKFEEELERDLNNFL